MTVMRVGLEIDLPEVADGGGVTVATGDGGLVYLRGGSTPAVLVWNPSTGAWEVGMDELGMVRRLLEEILVRLDGAKGLPVTRDTQVLADWAATILQ